MATKLKRRRLSPARQRLVERYMPYARACAWRYAAAYRADGEELCSVALFALTDAAATWDRSRNVSFYCHAKPRVNGALWDATHARGRLVPAPMGDPRAMEAVGTVVGVRPEPPVGWELEEDDALTPYLALLDDRLARLCVLIYRDGVAQGEAGRRVGWSDSAASAAHDRLLAILRGEADSQELLVEGFVRECLRADASGSTPMAAIYAALLAWCERRGRRYTRAVTNFGRDLRAATGGFRVKQDRDCVWRVVGYSLAS